MKPKTNYAEELDQSPMSAHKRRVRLSPDARDDLKDILKYSSQQWGARQGEQYRERLLDGIDEIAIFPLIGRSRPEYGEEVRSRKISSYSVIYKPLETQILVIRILHQRQDIEGIMDVTAE
jgi:toxin ParE1/3/4